MEIFGMIRMIMLSRQSLECSILHQGKNQTCQEDQLLKVILGSILMKGEEKDQVRRREVWKSILQLNRDLELVVIILKEDL